jgi:predicted peptidase
MRRCLFLLACTVFCETATFASADEPPATKNAPATAVVDPQQSQLLERTIKVTLKYLLYLPEDYEKQASWPLVLFLHGSGERGDDLQLVKKHGPPKLIAAGRKFPFIVVSPQAPKSKGRGWEPFELTALLDDVSEHYKVDADRVYVTGLSMGGYGAWSLAAYTPDRFAAIVPICGGGDPALARRLAKLPIWVFHGAKDPVVPLERSEVMVEALKKRESDVKFTVYPEALHDSWTETYENPQLYEWLLKQRRPAPEAESAK